MYYRFVREIRDEISGTEETRRLSRKRQGQGQTTNLNRVRSHLGLKLTLSYSSLNTNALPSQIARNHFSLSIF